jgi:hypothetical protein
MYLPKDINGEMSKSKGERSKWREEGEEGGK